MCVNIFGGWELPVWHGVAEYRIPDKFYLVNPLWSQYVQSIYFVIKFFYFLIINVSYNAAISVLEVLWIQACLRNWGIHNQIDLLLICWVPEQKLSFETFSDTAGLLWDLNTGCYFSMLARTYLLFNIQLSIPDL